jgi:RND superfamily putative drug exporter
MRWLAPALVVVGFLAVGGALSGPGGKLADVQRNDSTAYLPAHAEATEALAESKRFTGLDATPAILVYTKAGGITESDVRQLTLAAIAINSTLNMHLASPPAGPILSDDGQAAEIVVPLMGSDPKLIRPDVDLLRQGAGAVEGMDLHVGGPAAALADLTEVFGAVDGVVLLVALAAVLVVLVVAYRSPVLPFVVLAVAGIALGIANGTVYLLAKQGLLTVSGDAQGILDVLVLGAGTDYALLLIARYREEFDMRRAWRSAAPAIVASGTTVILALLCLLASDLASTRGLGPVSAIGIAAALVSMLFLLPAVLVLLGRVAFWPSRPTTGRSRLAAVVGRRPRLVWTGTALVLAMLCLGLVRLEAHGVPRTESFRAKVDSNAAQDLLDAHYPEASAVPAVVLANASRLDAVIAAARLPGVTKITTYVDPLAQLDAKQAGAPPPGPMTVDGRIRLVITMDAAPDSPRATGIVRALRSSVHAVTDADARVGGYTATNLDIQATAARDRTVVIPLVLGLVLLVLIALLRAVVAPLLLVATVVLSFFATLGVCGVVFRDVFGFAGADSSFPLFAFVFLVALGVDYNIFLMTRVREEVATRGHRAGTLRGLAVTGGVITSAGVVLAATFAALSVLPLVFLVELSFAVSFGVLLDALVVRSLLVPALTVDLGPIVWWPQRPQERAP